MARNVHEMLAYARSDRVRPLLVTCVWAAWLMTGCGQQEIQPDGPTDAAAADSGAGDSGRPAGDAGAVSDDGGSDPLAPDAGSTRQPDGEGAGRDAALDAASDSDGSPEDQDATEAPLPDLGDERDERDEGNVAPCPPAPPEAPEGLQCHVWECGQQQQPQCWSCEIVQAGDGTECVRAGDDALGVCYAGVCAPLVDPGGPGRYEVLTAHHDLQLTDGVFGRQTSMSIYLPDAAGAFPVVVFLHGFQLDTDLYESYGRHLASWGYAVVMPQMPGALVGGPNHTELKQYLILVLDWLVESAAQGDGPLLGRADPARVALAGHSLGGKIALLAATEDPRPLAVFGIDPVDAAGGPLPGSEEDYPSVTPELMARVAAPVGLVGETTNATCEGFMCQACAPQDDNFHQYYLHAESPAIEIEVLGANHMSFLDNPDCGFACAVCPAGTDAPATTRLLTRRYLTAFLNTFVANEDAYLRYLTGAPMAEDVAAGLVLWASNNGL